MKIKKLIQAVIVLVTLTGFAAFGAFDASQVNAAADTCTWAGTTSANWATGTNWTGCDNGGVPQSGDALIFPLAATNRVTTNNIGAISLTTITFADDYTIGGSAVTVTTSAAITHGTATINAPVVIGADLAFTSSGNGAFAITSTLDLSSHALTIDGGGTTGSSISAIISGTGGIIKANAATNLSLSGNNTYSGLTAVLAGAISITNANALGTAAGGTTVANGATVNINAGGLTIAEPIVITGSGNVGGGALRNFTGANTWSGDISVSGTSELNSDSGQFLTVTGHLAGAATALQLNGKIIFANATNSYTGTLGSFSGADIRFNGSIPIAFLSGGAVGGTGTIGNLTVSGTTSVNPGSTSAAIFSTGSETLSATTTVNMELRSGVSDQLNVTGTVNLASAILATDLDFAPTDGTQFTLINNDGADAVTSTFAGLAEGSTFTTGGASPMLVSISYVGGTGNDVVLTAINPVAPIVTPPVTPGVPNTGIKSENLVLNLILGALGFALVSFAIVRTVRILKLRA